MNSVNKLYSEKFRLIIKQLISKAITSSAPSVSDRLKLIECTLHLI